MKPLILSDLQQANKYAFVQDFKKAEEILKAVGLKHESIQELLFRRVELAERNQSLDSLLDDLGAYTKIPIHQETVKIAILLAKIKKYFYLSKKSEPIFPEEPFDIPFTETEKITRLSRKKIKIERHAVVPDDSVLPTSNEAHHIHSTDPAHLNNLLQQAFAFYQAQPHHYAACYLAGYAYYYLGNFPEAMLKWKQALSLNSHSMCTLSVLAEMQLLGLINEPSDDFCLRLESIDKFLVHGHIGTHTELYNEFITLKDFSNAISSLRTLSDWILKQYGSIPLEVEVICLLGIMKAHKLAGNSSAYLNYKNDIENVVIAHKKGSANLEDFILIAQLCEEYDLNSLAKNCYFSILTSRGTATDKIIEVAFHCVSHYPSESLLNTLKKAYENHPTSAKLKSCILLCSLHLKGIKSTDYLEIKEKIRTLILSDKSETAFPFLNDISQQFNDDPEIHYYLAEMYFHKGHIEKANVHFQSMYNLDINDPQSALKYLYFLLHKQDYAAVLQIANKSLSLDPLEAESKNELRWCLAVAYLAQQNHERARQEILKSLENDPWNPTFISLHIRCCLGLLPVHLSHETLPLIERLEDHLLHSSKSSTDQQEALSSIFENYSLSCAQRGFTEIAWLFAKCAYVMQRNITDTMSELLSKTAAAYLPQQGVKELLALLNSTEERAQSLLTMGVCIASTYAMSAQWMLVDEWVQIATPLAVDSQHWSHVKLRELAAFSLAMQGKDFKRAQVLLESALTTYKDELLIPTDIQVLYGYLLVAQGKVKVGLEKIQSTLTQQHSIKSIYFAIKAFERSEQLAVVPKEWFELLSSALPINPAEQKMTEEIFHTVGLKIATVPLGLAC